MSTATAVPETVLGFDYGTRKIGVAVGQSVTGTASPLPPLKARDGIPDWQQVEHLINEWQPRRFIVGLPLNMDGSESELSARARKFANRLHGRFGLMAELVDERLTTREARDLLKTRDNHRQSADSVAAMQIIEDWFAQQAAG